MKFLTNFWIIETHHVWDVDYSRMVQQLDLKIIWGIKKIFTWRINMNSKYKILVYFLFAIIVLLFLGGATIDLNTLLITGSVAALGILTVLPIKEDAEE